MPSKVRTLFWRNRGEECWLKGALLINLTTRLCRTRRWRLSVLFSQWLQIRLCIPNFCSFLRAWRVIQLFKYTTSKSGLYTFDVAHCIVVFFPSRPNDRLIFSSRTRLICTKFKKKYNFKCSSLLCAWRNPNHNATCSGCSWLKDITWYRIQYFRLWHAFCALNCVPLGLVLLCWLGRMRCW